MTRVTIKNRNEELTSSKKGRHSNLAHKSNSQLELVKSVHLALSPDPNPDSVPVRQSS
jgi:hypothetical protein